MKIAVYVTMLAMVGPIIALFAACGGGGEDDPTQTQSQETEGAVESVTITIGNFTDKTGVASGAIGVIDMALEDIVGYYNEQNLIPGVQLEIISYDGQWKDTEHIPGYESLRQQGADLIWTPAPPAVETLKPIVDADKFLLFAVTANVDLKELEGGYVFSLGITPEYEAYTLLKWIAENDPDFPKGRPAKIGGAAWLDGYSKIWYEAIENYADAHPDQYEWVYGYLSEYSFVWDAEVEGLKDCDYLYVPAPMHMFARQYRDAGHTAKFIGTDVQAAFLGPIDNAGLWNEIDGSLFIRSSQWFNEKGAIIDLANQLLIENHPDTAEETRRVGSGYLSIQQEYMMLEIIRNAVETVGPENFDSQALYNAATSFSFSLGGIKEFATFDENKRCVQNYYGIYEVDAAQKDLFRVDPKWYEQVFSP